MKITMNGFSPASNGHNKLNTTNNKQNPSSTYTPSNFVDYKNALAAQNKAFINFKGYYGDNQPIKKLYWILTNNSRPQEDNWGKDRIYQYGYKKWINALPNEILRRTPSETIDSIMMLTENEIIPGYIPTPDIKGNNWGRHANYIEINPRLVAKYNDGNISDGLFSTMKLMTIIPPSAENSANCLVLSQLYPSLNGDGTTNDETLYHTNLHAGISKNLTARGLDNKMGDDEQVKAFNDMAHLLGFKTGIRMPLSEGQLRIKGHEFRWDRDEKAFIDACTWAIELGFDSIYFDSAKHILDIEGYCGIGKLPDKEQMTYILRQIKEKTGRQDLSFVGEKCNPNAEYKEIGFNAGVPYGDSSNIANVKWESEKQSLSYEYASGPEVSNDNDYGQESLGERLNKMESCMSGYNDSRNRLPSFMQINDILPLSSYINTHLAMTNVCQMNDSNAWTECERHWDGVFRKDSPAYYYTQEVYRKFKEAIYK